MPAAEHEIFWRGPELGKQRGTGTARRDIHSAGADREQLGVVVGAQAVGAALYETVHHRHPGRACDGQQSLDVGQCFPFRFAGQCRQPRVGSDDRALQLLRDDDRVGRVYEFGFHTGAAVDTS